MEETQITGIFDGENMVGEDGKIYPVNSNYASKSKLNEGDELLLVIGEDGSFIFKQVSRVYTVRIRAVVHYVDNKCMALTAEGKQYKILKAAASYFHLKDDDEVVILTPKDHESEWASVENVIRILKDDEKELEL